MKMLSPKAIVVNSLFINFLAFKYDNLHELFFSLFVNLRGPKTRDS